MAEKLVIEFDGDASAEALMRSSICRELGDMAAAAYWLEVKDSLTFAAIGFGTSPGSDANSNQEFPRRSGVHQ